METLKFVGFALSSAMEFALETYQEHPVRICLLAVCALMMFIGVLGMYFQRVPYIRGGFFQFLYVLLSPSGALIMVAIGLVFFFADTMIDDVSPEMFSLRFFAETIIAAVIHGAAALGLVLWKYAALESRERRGEIRLDKFKFDLQMGEDLDEFGLTALGSLLGIIFSVVCMITGLQTNISSFAFSLFGARLAIGEWILKAYCAWVTGVILSLLKQILLLPVQLLYGGPLEV